LRFARAGGRVERLPKVAAMIELGAKPEIAVLESAARRLLAKYAASGSPDLLPPTCVRRLTAYLNLERASVFAARRQWPRMLWSLARSLARVPRTSLHLQQFWDAA